MLFFNISIVIFLMIIMEHATRYMVMGNDDDDHYNNRLSFTTTNSHPSSSSEISKIEVLSDASTSKVDDLYDSTSLLLNTDQQRTLEDRTESALDHGPSTAIKIYKNNTLQSFPSMKKQGGIIFFLHIPKTGGTTIRLNLEQYNHIQYIFAKNYSTYWETSPIVENAVLHGTVNQTILFYEIHATTSPSFHKLHKKLTRWKQTARRNGVPILFMTLIRDSISYAISHFNFFHVQKRNPTFEQCNATTTNFKRLSLHNPQCQFLFGGEASMRAQHAINKIIHREECNIVKQHLFYIMDYIGTTEQLTNETLPLLSRIMNLPNNHTWKNHKVSKDNHQGAVYFDKTNITKDVVQEILQRSIFDIDLYNTVKSQYRVESNQQW